MKTKAQGAKRARGLWLQWALATTAGFIIGGFAAGAAAKSLEAYGGDEFGLTPWQGAVVGAIAGLAIGICQWLVLRRAIVHAGSWALVTIAGWALFDTALATSGRSHPIVGAGVVVLATLAFALLQWLVLRRQAAHAGRWIVLSAGALAVACFAGIGVIFAAEFGRWFQLEPTDFPSALPWGLAGMVMGPVYGVMTGAALLRLVHLVPTSATGTDLTIQV